MKKIIFTVCAVAGLLMASCGGQSNEAKKQEMAAKKQMLLGKWVVPLDSATMTGFELQIGGVATPINTAWPISTWQFSNDTLYLTTADTQTIPWIVKSVNQDSLVITQDNVNNSVWLRGK